MNIFVLINSYLIKPFSSLLGNALAFALIGLRPLLGPATCRYNPTCTPFAINQLRTQQLHQALWNISKRLFFCSPLHRFAPQAYRQENS